MSPEWFVDRCRAAAKNLAQAGEPAAAAALDALAEEIESECARMRQELFERPFNEGRTELDQPNGSE
jgi:hypothetical protein